MATDPLNDVVASQYERWVYPAPIDDLPGWLESNWQWFDPSHAHALLWPDRDYPRGLDILVAGCGTHQGAVIAYTNPSARVVAIDVSRASLDHHRRLAERYAVANLELHQLPVEHVASLDRDFDLIITTGVLHHMADPAAGMRALAECLRPDGVLAVMLYASYGRIGVEMMQSVFRDLGLQQDEESLQVVRDALAQLGPEHPLAGYLRMAPDLGDDAGLVDTFLHGRETAYTIGECIEMVRDARLAFQDIYLKASYYPPSPTDSEFFACVAALPRDRQWSIMQRINSSNACHYFLACRPERSVESYAIDFDSDAAFRYVPSFRKGCGLADYAVRRHDGWTRQLTPLQAELVARVDGLASLEEIAQGVLASGGWSRGDRSGINAEALATFQSLWQLDFIALSIPTRRASRVSGGPR